MEKTGPKLHSIFSQLSNFVDKSADYLKGIGGEPPPTQANEEDGPDEFMPLKHLHITENLMLKNKKLLDLLLRLESRLRFHENNKEKRRGLTQAYVKVIEDI